MISKIKYLFLLAVLSAGCTKEQPDNLPRDDKYVSLRIHLNSDVVTRASVDNKHPLGKTTIWDAGIYFYRGTSKEILMFYPLTVSDIAELNTGGSESITIPKVPVSSDNMLFVANYAASTGKVYPYSNSPTPTNGIDAVSGATITTANQMKENDIVHSAESVLMSGGATISINTEQDEFESVSLTISPQVARLEIAKLTAKNVNGTDSPDVGDILSYTVNGIYINYYYYKTNLLGQHRIGDYASTIFPVDNRPTENDDKDTYYAEKYNGTYTGGIQPWSTGYANTKMFIEPQATDGSSINGEVAAGANRVWAFQLFEGNTVHVIIRLENIIYSDGTGGETENDAIGESGDRYITIESFNYQTGGVIAGFRKARVYRIFDIPFTANDITKLPYEKAQYFRITVSVSDWTEATIDTDYD